MFFALTDDQQEFGAAVRAYLAERFDMATHDHSIVDSMRRRVIELDMGQVVRDEARAVYGVGR